MNARQVIEELRRYGFSLTERAGKLVISPRAQLTPAMLAAVIENRDEMLRLLPQVGTLLWDTPEDADFRLWPLGARPAVVVLPDFAAEKPPEHGAPPAAPCHWCNGARYLRRGQHEHVCISCHPPAHKYDPAAILDTTRPASQDNSKEPAGRELARGFVSSERFARPGDLVIPNKRRKAIA